MDFDDACACAQRQEIRESFAYDPDERLDLVRNWREALMKRLLTPTPDAASVAWKRRTFEQA